MRDPVCGVHLDKPTHSSRYLKCPYFFCSEECKRKFDENPRLYLSESAQGA
jgi:YHS domain-containing protein